MRALLLLYCSVVMSMSADAQSTFLPKNLGPGVNSSYDDVNPVISPDGKLLFFVRVNHPDNTYGENNSEDIWFCERVTDSTWSAAKRIPNLNIGRYNAVLSFLNDGKSILLNGVYNKKADQWKKRGVSIASHYGDGWNKPVQLKVKGLSRINRGLRSSAAMSANGQLMVLSFSKKIGGKRNDLFISERSDDGIWKKPKKLNSINTRANEETPFLSADGKTIYFASDRTGDFNIYKATRVGDFWDNLSSPVLLSDTVNSVAWDSYFKTTKQGDWAYFATSGRNAINADIFRVKLFEKNPFAITTGNIVNSRSQVPLIGKDVTILVNGNPVDSISINTDSATYRLKLPLGKSYTLSAVINNYVSVPAVLDVTQKKEFLKIKLDLPATPFPYVLVKGKIIIQNTGLPVPAQLATKILVNNTTHDSIRVNLNPSTYELKLNHGQVYELRAEAIKHESIPHKLDLSKITEYQEIIQDLYVSEEQMAVITGKILDKKTNKPLADLSSAKVNVEGMATVFAKIDSVSGDYELKLPLGALYTISAGAPNYYPLYESIDIAAEKTGVKIYKDLIIIPIEVGQSIRLNNIFFDPAKATLKSESFAELDRVSEFLSNNPSIKIEIAGHTDNVGKAASNLALSQNRAQSVADYVVKKGIDKARVVAKGYGFTKPVASNATKEGKAQNRRVEFTVLDN